MKKMSHHGWGGGEEGEGKGGEEKGRHEGSTREKIWGSVTAV